MKSLLDVYECLGLRVCSTQGKVSTHVREIPYACIISFDRLENKIFRDDIATDACTYISGRSLCNLRVHILCNYILSRVHNDTISCK